MKQTKKFKVSTELRDYIRNVLARDNVFHRFITEDDQLYCIAAISGERFHKVVKRALCEKRTAETGLLHVTYEESKNDALCEALMKLHDANSFVVISNKK